MPFTFAKQTAYLLRPIFLFIVLLTITQFVSAQVTDTGKVAPADSVPPPATDTVKVPDTPAHPPPVKPVVPKPVQVINPPVADTSDTGAVDTVVTIPKADSVSERPWEYSSWDIDLNIPISNQVLYHHPYFSFNSKPVIVHTGLKDFKGKELLFYSLVGLLLAFALLRQAFPKYFNDLFRLLFRTTLKQKQVREQLMQTPLPSLLLNIFFVVSAGMYINILLHYFDKTPVNNFWLLFLYCVLGLAIIYTVKFFGLKICGWLFNLKGPADIYIFVVFVINKVIGIFLLPFIVLLSFMQENAFVIAMVISWCGVGLLLLYRYLLAYASVRNQVKFNPFHFFLYLCAFEIAPLLLIYKALLFFFH